MGWGGPPDGADVVLSMRRLDRVLEHAAGDMTATAEAGCTIESLQRTLAERGQRLALDPLWPGRATVGGVLATADSGPLRVAYGAPRDLLLGVTVALADGTLARSGGKVVKNVAGYDLPKLFTGSFGTLGAITQAMFRLHPLPGAVRDLCFELPPGAVGRFVAVMGECSLLVAAAQVRVEAGATVACVRVESLPEAIEAKVARVERAVVEGGATRIEGDVAGEWGAGERLFEGRGRVSAVVKVGITPAQIEELVHVVASSQTRSQLVMQVYGVGLIRIDAEHADELAASIGRLRAEVGRLGGSLVVLEAPPEVKRHLGVWGEAGDALPLMRRVKHQFDPAGTLNPGRFVGGI